MFLKKYICLYTNKLKMDVMRKLADSLGAGTLVSSMSDESLVAAVRQLLGYSPGDTFEHLRTQVRTQASLFGEDIDGVLSERQQLAVFRTIAGK